LRGFIDNREHLVAYLLGELSADQEGLLEQEYLADDDAYQQLLVVEDELAYDYLNGRLSPQRRQLYESTIGATERGRRNLEFARALVGILRQSQRSAARPARYWTIGIAAVLMLGALPAWLAIHVAGLKQEIERLQADAVRMGREIAAANGARPVEAAFLLTPGMSRGGDGPPRLHLAANADTIRFEMVPPPGAASGDFIVAINSAGAEVWSRSAAISGRTLVVTAPAKLFGAGDYEISIRRLTAGEPASELASYFFRLTKK
jgi:hypothetical protein